MLTKLWRFLIRDWWVARVVGWPHANEARWGTYNPRRNTVLDTGLTKTQAKAICRQLNNRRGS